MRPPLHLPTAKGLLLGLLTAFVLVFVGGGYGYYRREVQAIRTAKYGELRAIAELKVGQIVAWRQSQLSNAHTHSAGLIRVVVPRWLKTPADRALQAEVQAGLKALRENRGYQNVALAAPEGGLLLSTDPGLAELEPHAQDLVRQTVASREAAFGDLFRCTGCRQVHLDVAAPVLDAGQHPVAVLLLRSDPQAFLYPLVQSWPIPSQSAETLLACKEGADVVFLNPLRHRPDAALTARIPLTCTEVPAVQAVLGLTGIFEGKDYRGVPVVSDIRPVPDSSWFMIAKVDASEILAEARYRGVVVLLIVILGIAVAFGMAALVFDHRQRNLYENLFRAERERRDAQEEIRATLYGIGDAVIATDTAGRVTRMNPAAERLTGWQEAEALGQDLNQIFRIVNEDTGAAVAAPVERVLRHGEIVGLFNHTMLIARDGTQHPIADSGAPIRNEKGAIIGAVLVFRDQAAERAAQKRLQESEARLRAILDVSPFPIALVDIEDSNIEFWSSSALALFGHVSPRVAEWYQMAYPDPDYQREVVRRWQGCLEQAKRSGRAVNTGEYRVACRDGSTRICELHAAFLADKLVVTFNDITERRQAEEALRELSGELEARVAARTLELDRANAALAEEHHLLVTLMENTPAPIYFKDVEGRFLRVNQALVRLYGLHDSAQIVGKTDQDFYDQASAQHFLEEEQEIMRTGHALLNHEEMDTRPNHTATWFLTTKMPLRDPAGHVSGTFGISFDISARKQMEATLQARNEELRDFAYTVSHDLKAPLRGIAGYAQELDRRHRAGLTDRAQFCIDQILTATRNLDHLIEDLLRYSRLDAETPSCAPVNVRSLVEAILQDRSLIIARQGTEVVLEMPAAAVTTWERGLLQVLANLIDNAIKYSRRASPPHIVIRTETLEHVWRLSVADNGVGFDMKYHDRVFGLFNRLVRAEEFEGTGVGLAIVRKVLAKMGGKVWAKAALGTGATFYIELPVGGTQG